MLSASQYRLAEKGYEKKVSENIIISSLKSSWFNCKLSLLVIIYFKKNALIIISYKIEREKMGKSKPLADFCNLSIPALGVESLKQYYYFSMKSFD